MKKITLLLSLSIVLSATVFIFNSCFLQCKGPMVIVNSTLNYMSIANLDSPQIYTILDDDTITISSGNLGFYIQPEFDIVKSNTMFLNEAYACKPAIHQDITQFSIQSNQAFDNLHPANSSLNDIVFVNDSTSLENYFSKNQTLSVYTPVYFKTHGISNIYFTFKLNFKAENKILNLNSKPILFN